MVQVHYGEGVATHTGPESCGCGREAAREALTGVRAGQVWSGESNAVRGADAVVAVEGNRRGSVSARTWATPRRLSSTLRILAKVERRKFNGLQNIDTNGSAFLPGRTYRKRFQTAENAASIMAEVEK